MTILEFIRSKLMEFPKIAEICNTVHVDFTDSDGENYGLSSVGDALLGEDILGNQKRQHNFVLYAMFQSVNDYDRMNNSGVLYELQLWLEQQAQRQELAVDVCEKTRVGTLEKITVSNGMLFEVPNENNLDLVRYQIQISAHYFLKE